MSKKIIDVTEIPLTPGFHGWRCLGNGKNEVYECCCDECNYYLKCFPEHLMEIRICRIKRKIKKMLKK